MPKNVYEFVATGQGDVIKAYESIGAAATRQKKVVEETARATAKARSGGTTGGRGTSPEDRKFKEAEKAAAKYERELQKEVRATQKAEAQKRAVEQRSAQARERQERAANARRERAAERSASTERRVQERAQKHVAAVKDRHFREEQKKAERADAARARTRTTAIARSARERDASRAQSWGTVKDLGAGALLGGTAAIAAVIGSATRESMALQESANRISINARKSGEGFLGAGSLRRGFERTAADVKGVRSQDVADAVGKFISLTGDVNTAVKGQGVFATVASATGSGVGDVAEAAASLAQQFDITGLEDMKEVLAALTFQGKEGAFELRDAASQFQRLAASGAAFGIPKGVQGVKTLGGLTQIARTGTGSAEQAATAVENLLTNLKVKADKLGEAGVDVYDKNTGKARDVRDLITESIAKVGGTDIGAKQGGLSKIFGEQGIRAINPLIAKYNETFRETKGSDAEKTAAAMARLREEFTKSIDAAGDWDDVLQDSAQAQTDSSAQMTGAWERIKAAVGDEVAPKLAEFVSKLAGENGADGALTPFIMAVGTATDVLVSLADALYDTGIIKRKEKTHSERIAEGEKELKRFDKKAGIGPLTPAQMAERNAILDKIGGAEDALWGKGDKAVPDTMTPDDFAKRYVEANPGAFDDQAEGIDAAKTMAGRIKAGNAGAQTNDFFMQTVGGENQAQTDLRRQYQGQVAAEKLLNTDAAQQSVDMLAKASADAASRIAASGQGTIFAGQ